MLLARWARAAAAAATLALLAANPCLAASGAAAETVSVVVKKTAIRRDKQFYAPAVAEASYGEKLTVLEKGKDWLQVKSAGGTGWVHASAVTTKTVKASSGGGGPAVSSDDVTLAGKGFNRQVESEYRKKNPEANFAAVDRMEKLTASEGDIAAIVRDGRLEPRGGGK